MKTHAIFKLIVRSWWRNKIFFLISIISLTVGLVCTNFLFTFFIHEYNIESTNQDKAQIFCLRQDSPMEEGVKVTYAGSDIPGMLKEKYAEVQDYLQIGSLSPQYCKIGEKLYSDVIFITADTTLLHFFNYQIKSGNLKEALIKPDQAIISEEFARKVFGNDNPIGEHLEVKTIQNVKTFEIKAVVKKRAQSFLHFDLLTGHGSEFWGGVTLLKLTEAGKADVLETKMKSDKVPTLLPNKTQYYVEPLSNLYFADDNNSHQQPFTYIQQSNVQLLYISLIASLLVLIIACCNYTNLSMSRILQQLKMIHVEKLMGGTVKDIRIQLFSDAFLTVLIAFLLSLLIINDCLPFFNQLLSARLSFDFFFNMQILPLLLLFILFMSIVPGIFISKKLSGMTVSEYKNIYTGKKKQKLLSLLVMIQFIISIGLLFATFAANEQMQIVREKAGRYENQIEVGDYMSPPQLGFMEEVKKQVKGVEAASLSNGSFLNSWLQQISLKKEDGTEVNSSVSFISSDKNILATMDLKLLQGETPEKLLEKYPRPVLVNEQFVKVLVPPGSECIGHRLNEFMDVQDTLSTIRGIVEDFPVNSLEEPITPFTIDCSDDKAMASNTYLQIKIKEGQKAETLKALQYIWEEMFPGQTFNYKDLHQEFMKRNHRVIMFSRILITYSVLALLLTCFGLFGISWFAIRQRIKEIGLRKIHGATLWQIMWIMHKPFFLQMSVAYVIAVPIIYRFMLHWREQFVVQSEWSIWIFVLPLVIVATVTVLTVCAHSYLAAKTNPIEIIKSE